MKPHMCSLLNFYHDDGYGELVLPDINAIDQAIDFMLDGLDLDQLDFIWA